METNLEKLLDLMSPKLIHGEYAFCTIKNAKYGDFAEANPIASYIEEEGLTLVLRRESAEEFELSYKGVFRCITLMVHSSLHAVGLTAAVSGKLSEHGISANIIAASFHDHIFIPSEYAEKALNLLLEFKR